MPGQFEDGQARPRRGQADRVAIGATGPTAVPSTMRAWIPPAISTRRAWSRRSCGPRSPSSDGQVGHMVSAIEGGPGEDDDLVQVGPPRAAGGWRPARSCPRPASDRSRPRIQRIPSGSSPFSGSSRSAPGSPSRAPARSAAGACPARAADLAGRGFGKPTWSSTSPTRRADPAARGDDLKCSGALRPGWKMSLSSAAPTWRSGSGSSRSRPRDRSRAGRRGGQAEQDPRVVVFPAPFGPRKPVTLPGWTSKDRSSTARTGP